MFNRKPQSPTEPTPQQKEDDTLQRIADTLADLAKLYASQQKEIDEMQDRMIQLARNGAIHADCINFIFKNTTYAPEAQKDFLELATKIAAREKQVNEAKKTLKTIDETLKAADEVRKGGAK